MQITVLVKQLGKKRPAIDPKVLEIQDLPQPPTLGDLLTNVVHQQVDAFNARREQEPLVPFLLNSEVEDQAALGKVGFGEIANKTRADRQKAVDHALQSFEDGIFCVFIDDEQIERLDDLVQLTDNSVIAFIRLTFLAGSFW